MSIKNDIKKLIQKNLIEKARTENKLIHFKYQDLIFTANELERHNTNGEFLWAVDNFELISPQNRVELMERRIELAKTELERFKKRLENEDIKY